MTVSRARLLVVVLLGAALVGGCGAASPDRQSMEVKFERIDFQFSTLETANAAFNSQHLARATQRYIAGRASYLEVLTAQQELFPAERSLAQTQINQRLVIIQLYRALGGGWNIQDPNWSKP